MDWRSHFNHKMTMTAKVNLNFVVLSWSIRCLMIFFFFFNSSCLSICVDGSRDSERNGNIRNHIVCRNANTFRIFMSFCFRISVRSRHFNKNSSLMRTRRIKMIKFMTD